MSEEKEIVNLSVRGLVEFMFRGGDITSGGSGVPVICAVTGAARAIRSRSASAALIRASASFL